MLMRDILIIENHSRLNDTVDFLYVDYGKSLKQYNKKEINIVLVISSHTMFLYLVMLECVSA